MLSNCFKIGNILTYLRTLEACAGLWLGTQQSEAPSLLPLPEPKRPGQEQGRLL